MVLPLTPQGHGGWKGLGDGSGIVVEGDIADTEPAFLPSTLSGLVEFDGYYLESDPCLVCNNPEVPFCVSNILSRAVLRFSGSCCLALWILAHHSGFLE